MDVIFTYGGSTSEVCITAALWIIPLAGFTFWVWSEIHAAMHWVAVLSTALSRWEPHAAELGVLQPLQKYGGAYSLGGLAEGIPIPLSSFHGGKGSSFPCLVPPDDTVESKSVVGMKPGDSTVVIGYWVDEFSCTWLV